MKLAHIWDGMEVGFVHPNGSYSPPVRVEIDPTFAAYLEELKP